MIRNETQRRRAIREREELVAAGSGDAKTEQRLGELEEELAEYETLRSAETQTLTADSAEAIGELLIKARIARRLTISELGELLSMSEQQVGRYEQEAWSRASLWRLAQVSEALEIEVEIRATITAQDEDAEAVPSGNFSGTQVSR